MTANEPTCREPKSSKKTISLNGLAGIFGTARVVTAGAARWGAKRTVIGRERSLVEADEFAGEGGHVSTWLRRSVITTSRSSASALRRRAAGLTRSTTTVCGASRGPRRRSIGRRRLFSRLRSTALFSVCRLTTIAVRARPPPARLVWTTIARLTVVLPYRTVETMSRRNPFRGSLVAMTVLDGQPTSAFPSASSECAASARRRHACTKPVDATPAPFLGLICPFRHKEKPNHTNSRGVPGQWKEVVSFLSTYSPHFLHHDALVEGKRLCYSAVAWVLGYDERRNLAGCTR